MGYTPGGSHGKVAKYLENRISYHITEDDIVPFTLFEFGDDPSNYVESIILGPANKIADKDMKIFLEKHKYKRTTINTSKITYR